MTSEPTRSADVEVDPPVAMRLRTVLGGAAMVTCMGLAATGSMASAAQTVGSDLTQNPNTSPGEHDRALKPPGAEFGDSEHDAPRCDQHEADRLERQMQTFNSAGQALPGQAELRARCPRVRFA